MRTGSVRIASYGLRMLHPVLIETIVSDHQHHLHAAAEKSRGLPRRAHAPFGPGAWAAWWYAGRTARGRAAQPAVHEAYLPSLR